MSTDTAKLASRAAFGSAEKAWFWTMSRLCARQDGRGVERDSRHVDCDPDTVVKVLDTLYRQRKVTLEHARVLGRYGERGAAPNPGMPTEKADFRLWREAMDLMEWPLALKGIVPNRRGFQPAGF